MFATQKLITSFMKLNPAALKDQAYQRCQTSQTEVSFDIYPLHTYLIDLT